MNVGTLPDGSQYPGILWNDGDNSAIRNLGAGTYFVDLTDKDGCTYRHTITVIESPKPVWNIAAYNATHCDDNFDGIIPVNLNTVTPVIIGNAAGFTVHYYLNQDDAIAGNNNYIQNPAAWSYSANTTLYVNAFSQYCPGEVKQIDFKFGTNFPLLTSTASENVCSSSNTVNLNSYSNLFTSDGTVPKFFATLANAQNNTPTIGATQTITADKTFYFRYSKPGFCDVIGTLNLIYKLATPTALLNSYTVCQGSSITLNAESAPTYTAWLWKKGATVVSTTSQATLNAGVYTVEFTNPSGCVFTKTITVVDSPKPILNIAAYNASVCDSNFDGTSDPINFNSVTPIIVTNYAGNAALFNIRYYLNQSDRDAGNNNTIPNLTNWTFTVPTTVYVRAETQYCTYIADEIQFNFGTSISLITAADTRTVCDTDLNGSEVVNLASYRTLFTTDGTASVKYFDDLAKAQLNLPGTNIPVNQTITADKMFYYRFSKAGFCDAIGALNLVFKQATPTALLSSYTVCPGSSITLNAEGSPTYTAWLWKKGATVVSTTSQATLNAGVYTVAFTNASGCVFTKTITVSEVELPVISNIEIIGSTVTVTVTGGNPPYQYAIDNGNYQSSNVFYNVRGGDHIISVISKDNCAPVTKEISVVEPYNAITPNGDGINDVLNYSALLKKEEPTMKIFDRQGKLVFTGSQSNRFTWDGKAYGRELPTSSYWLVLQWREPGSATMSQYTGWVLVKNRD